MDNANDKTPVETGETKTTELTPELQAKLDQIQANQETLLKKEKKTGPLIALVVVLLLISAVCVAFSVMTKGKNKDGGTDVNGNSSAPVEQLSDVTDETVKSTLNDRFDVLTMTSYNQYNKNKKGEASTSLAFIFTQNGALFSNLRLTEKEKFYIIAGYYETRSDELAKVEKSDYKSKAVQKYKDAISESDFLKNGRKVKVDEVANLYKEVFGEEIKHQSLEECGANAHLGDDTGYYYFNFVGGCGGMDFRKIVAKKLAYKMSGENYYLDLGLTTVFDGQDDDGKNICAIFNGYYAINTDAWRFNMDDDKVAKKCENGLSATKLSEQIGDSEMTKFRLVFDKEFHFNKIERL